MNIVAETLTANDHKGSGHNRDRNDVAVAGTFQNTGHGWWNESPVAQTVRTPEGGGSLEANVIAIQDAAMPRAKAQHGMGDAHAGLPMYTLDGNGAHGVAHALPGEGHDASEDGTGRGTPLAVVPFDTTQATSAGNYSSPKAGDPRHPLAAGAHAPAIAFTERSRDEGRSLEAQEELAYALTNPGSGGRTHSRQIAQGMAVRRLTPRECERLQGFPDVSKTAIISVWHEGEKRENAPSAALNLPAHGRESSAPVAVRVLIDLERSAVQCLSRGRLIWSASSADGQSASLLPMPIGVFVRLAALITSTAGSGTPTGKAASPPNTTPSTLPQSGRLAVSLSGREIGLLADDAEASTAAINSCIKCITSGVEPSSQSCASAWKTLCCYAAHAIASSIPGLTPGGSSFALELTTTEGWTAGESDSARYRLLGNAVAVPVAGWIARRMLAVPR